MLFVEGITDHFQLQRIMQLQALNTALLIFGKRQSSTKFLLLILYCHGEKTNYIHKETYPKQISKYFGIADAIRNAVFQNFRVISFPAAIGSKIDKENTFSLVKFSHLLCCVVQVFCNNFLFFLGKSLKVMNIPVNSLSLLIGPVHQNWVSHLTESSLGFICQIPLCCITLHLQQLTELILAAIKFPCYPTPDGALKCAFHFVQSEWKIKGK